MARINYCLQMIMIADLAKENTSVVYGRRRTKENMTYV